MTVTPIVIGALGKVTKGLVWGLEDLEIRGRQETIQTTDQPEYWEESWKLEETCCDSDSSGKPSANTGVKNSQMRKYNNNNPEHRYLEEPWRSEKTRHTQISLKDHQWELVLKTHKK